MPRGDESHGRVKGAGCSEGGKAKKSRDGALDLGQKSRLQLGSCGAISGCRPQITGIDGCSSPQTQYNS